MRDNNGIRLKIGDRVRLLAETQTSTGQPDTKLKYGRVVDIGNCTCNICRQNNLVLDLATVSLPSGGEIVVTSFGAALPVAAAVVRSREYA